MNNLELTVLQPKELRKRARIILVDDIPAVLDSIERCLCEGFINISILKFTDGELAWREILRGKPDYLISDLLRAGLNGFGLLRRLAREETKFPILIVSAVLEGSQSAATRSAGSNLNVSFLEKPFSVAQLLAIVARGLSNCYQGISSRSVS
jgi:DNA-binding response OmpR family regulator